MNLLYLFIILWYLSGLVIAIIQELKLLREVKLPADYFNFKRCFADALLGPFLLLI